MERRRMIAEMGSSEVKWYTKIANCWRIFTNTLSDTMFGYGESILKMIITYVITVFFFAFLFSEEVSPLAYLDALGISLKNMAGVDSDVLSGVSPFVDMLNVLQTTLGILITGIFGFILGNKIRNQ